MQTSPLLWRLAANTRRHIPGVMEVGSLVANISKILTTRHKIQRSTEAAYKADPDVHLKQHGTMASAQRLKEVASGM